MAVRQSALKRALVTAALLTPLLLLVTLWAPVVRHYHVPTEVVTDSMLAGARDLPADTVLSELSSYYYFPTGAEGPPAAVAEQLLKGEVKLYGFGQQHIEFPFAPADLETGPIVPRLFVARLSVPRILIAAYRQTGDRRFLLGARDAILAWASYEEWALLPKGLLWNDHALAERVQVLAEFWLVYRHSPEYDPQVGRRVLRFAARSGAFLAKPSHFTAATNHGAMQNLALLHFSLAFPTLPESPRYAALGLARLTEQMTFYASHEGVILEHSAGYQRFGVQVLGTALRYLSLAHLPIPPAWDSTYEKAKTIYALLRRPDGTLPLSGDTEAAPDTSGPRVAEPDSAGGYPPLLPRSGWRPGKARALFAVGGYSVWWDGLEQWPRSRDLAQTLVAWSNYPSRVHKHADEMSVLFWSGGQSWWTNVGYWIDETWGDASGWNGSNAPHLQGESSTSDRQVRVLRYQVANGVTFLDLERTGPDRFVARRQVLSLAGERWVVLDQVSGGGSAVATTVWNTAPEVQVAAGESPGSWRLRQSATGFAMSAYLLGEPSPVTRLVRGSREPFAGWQMVETPQPTWAIIQEQPAASAWSMMAWSKPESASAAAAPTARPAIEWRGPDDWRLLLPLKRDTARISRAGDTLILSSPTSAGQTRIDLPRPPGVDTAVAAIHAAYARVAAAHPRFQDELPYRTKVTYVLLVLLIIQEVVLAAWRRVRSRPDTWLRLAALAGWVAVGVYFLFVRVRLI